MVVHNIDDRNNSAEVERMRYQHVSADNKDVNPVKLANEPVEVDCNNACNKTDNEDPAEIPLKSGHYNQDEVYSILMGDTYAGCFPQIG